MLHVETCFINKIYQLRNREGGGYSALVSYQSLDIKYHSIRETPTNYFLLLNLDKIVYS